MLRVNQFITVKLEREIEKKTLIIKANLHSLQYFYINMLPLQQLSILSVLQMIKIMLKVSVSRSFNDH